MVVDEEVVLEVVVAFRVVVDSVVVLSVVVMVVVVLEVEIVVVVVEISPIIFTVGFKMNLFLPVSFIESAASKSRVNVVIFPDSM